jgi:soluble lytic murein transglycosylase-like protein
LRKLLQLATAALLCTPLFAAEQAVLRNGFVIKHELHEVSGDNTRLFLDSEKKSYIDIPSAEIEKFEAVPAEPIIEQPKPPLPAVKKSKDLSQIVTDASDKHDIDPDLINSIIRAESSFNQKAKSSKGARGLMQLMPKTAAELGVQDSFDAEQNVEGGTKYLRALLEKYDYNLVKALAAYNAGPQRVDQYKGVPPYHETRAYVAKIVRDFNAKKRAQTTKKQ